MAPPERLEEFSYKEFHVVVERTGNQIRAVARDHKHDEVDGITGETLSEVRSDIKCRLNHISQDYAGVGSAINLFRRAFPGGFESKYYVFRERAYKDTRSRFMVENLREDQIDELLARGDFDTIGSLAKRAFSTSNLYSQYELIKFGDALKVKGLAKPFAELLRELLYGDFDQSLEDLAHLLRPHDAAKWPILSFWPFFRFPDLHMFLKPMMVQRCAERMGYDLHYESLPNRDTYHSLLGFAEFVREGIADLEPKDNIDIQSFIYAIDKEGYVRDAIRDRERRRMA